MADEPTSGELMRSIAELRRSVDTLAGKVMTVDLWRAEREAMDYRIRETEKDLADLHSRRNTDVEKRNSDRRMIFAALIAPILLLALQVWATSRGVGTP